MSRKSNKNNVFAIIGGAGAIGSQLARELASDGAHVYLGGRTSESLAKLAGEIDGGYRPVEATDFDSVQAFVEAAAGQWGRLDGLALCVGSILLKPAHLTSAEDWDDTIARNLTSAFAVVRAGARAMMKSGGSIVLLSSAAASVGLVNHEAIAAAKGGLEGLVRSAAATYAGRGIRVNAVAPGLVETPMSEAITANAASRKTSESMHPLGRLGQPGDVASALRWFLAPEQSWVTGQILGVDGGLSRLRPKAGK